MADPGIFAPLKGHENLKERTVELLTEAILAGEIKPGDRVNESQMSRQLQVSRSPVREALQQLQEQGLIVNVPRRGMFVVSLTEEDVQKINSLRVILEAEALRLGRDRLTRQGEEKLTQLVGRMERMKPAPTNESVRIDLQFHRTIWSLTGNEHIERMLVSLTTPLFAHAMLTLLRSEKQRMVLDSHRPLLDFVRGKSDQSAEEVMIAHLSLRWKDPAKFSSLKNPLAAAGARDASEA